MGSLGVPRGDPAYKLRWFAAKLKRTRLLWGKSPHFPPRPAREAVLGRQHPAASCQEGPQLGWVNYSRAGGRFPLKGPSETQLWHWEAGGNRPTAPTPAQPGDEPSRSTSLKIPLVLGEAGAGCTQP